MAKKVERKIEVERTLIIGDAKMSEGVSAFVKFIFWGDSLEGCPYWMYGTLTELTDETAVFRNAGGKFFVLLPEEIVEITDSPDLPKEKVEFLLGGGMFADEKEGKE